jgi:uncharacterized protein
VSSETPTAPDERIRSLDFIRGLAIFGILLINIQSFAMPRAARIVPTAYGSLSGANGVVWAASYVLADGKFLTIFTLLFGAGIALFVGGKADTDAAITLHYRRTFWLLVVGGVHAYLLWAGDILVVYGVTAALVVWAVRWPPRRLAAVGLAAFAVPLAVSVAAALTTDLGATRSLSGFVETELRVYRGSYADQLRYRVGVAFRQHTTRYLGRIGWRLGGLMLLGMALYKKGVLTDDRPSADYRRLAAGAGGIGLALSAAAAAVLVTFEFSAGAVRWRTVLNYAASLPLAVGYVAGFTLVHRRFAGSVVVALVRGVGRTALSNYLFQTVLLTPVFFGFGLGLYGTVSRVEQLGVVCLVWVLQTGLTWAWLRRFEYGPLEWAWRSLTYRSA